MKRDDDIERLLCIIRHIQKQSDLLTLGLLQEKDKVRELREALVIFGHHGRTDNTKMCEHMKHSDYPCTCGFEQALN